MAGFYRGWWQVGIALLIQAISGASIFTSYSLIVTPLKLEFQPSNTVLMLGITLVSMVSGIVSPILGKAIDQRSIRNFMLLGAVLLSLGFFLLSLAGNMIQVAIIYALCMAVGAVLLGPLSSATLLARWFNRRRGLAMGLASSGGAIGGLVLPHLIQGLIEGFEWRAALQIYSVVVFVATVPLIMLLVKDRPESDDMAIENPPETATKQQSNLTPLASKDLLTDLRFWLLTITIGSLFAGGMGVTSNMVQISSTKGVDAGQAALLLSIVSGATFGAKLLWSAFIDRLTPVMALCVMVVIQASGIIGFVISQNFVGLAIAIVICGLSSGGVSLAWSLTLSRIYGPARLGQVMGFMTLTLMPFTMLAPPLFGWSYDMTGSYNYGLIGYVIVLGLALAGLTQLRVSRETKPA